jgi:hypothetical protein
MSLVVVSGAQAQRYDFLLNRWITLKNVPNTQLNVSASAALGSRVYFAGGHDDAGRTLSCVFVHDLGSNEWVVMPPMGTAVTDAAAASLGGFIYVSGGEDDARNVLNLVQRFDPATSQWVNVASMITGRKSHKLVAVGGLLYAIGGLDDRYHLSSSVERFDPATNSWGLVGNMNTPRCDHAAAVLDGTLYVAGGRTPHASATSSCERFFSAGLDNYWLDAAPLPAPRASLALVRMPGGSLFAMGGLDATDQNSSAHWRYAAGSNEWVGAPLAADSPAFHLFWGLASWSATPYRPGDVELRTITRGGGRLATKDGRVELPFDINYMLEGMLGADPRIMTREVRMRDLRAASGGPLAHLRGGYAFAGRSSSPGGEAGEASRAALE